MFTVSDEKGLSIKTTEENILDWLYAQKHIDFLWGEDFLSISLRKGVEYYIYYTEGSPEIANILNFVQKHKYGL